MKARKINDEQLIVLLKEGRLQKDIAKELGVSEPAITKRLKRLYPERYTVPKVFEELTDKERAFVVEKARGKSNTEAALVAYDCTSRETAKVIGSQLMGKAEIRMGVDAALNVVGLTRLYRLSKLRTHVDSYDPVIGLKALDMAMKAGGDYDEPELKRVEDERNQIAFTKALDAERWVIMLDSLAAIGAVSTLKLSYAHYYLSLQDGTARSDAIEVRDEIEQKIEGWVRKAERKREENIAEGREDSDRSEEDRRLRELPIQEVKKELVELLKKRVIEENYPLGAMPDLQQQSGHDFPLNDPKQIDGGNGNECN